MMKRILCFTLVFVFMLGSVVSAEGDVSPISPKSAQLDSTSSFTLLSSTKAIVTQTFGQEIKLVHLDTSTVAWTKTYDRVIDVKILHNPDKIIALVEEKGVLKKVTLNATGVELAKQSFPKLQLKNDGGYNGIKWIAPSGKQGEMILVQDHEQIQFYQYPWKKPVRTIKLSTAPNTRYEYIHVQGFDYTAPYLVVNYVGGGMMQSQHFYQVTNVLNNQYFTRSFETYLDTDFTVQSGVLHITTYGQLGGPLGIDEKSAHTVAVQYDLKTGKTLNQISRSFEPANPNDWYGWRAKYDGGTLFVEDLGRQQWQLYDQTYTPITAVQPVTEWERMKYHYIFFNKTDGRISFLYNGDINQVAVQQVK